MSAWLLWPLVQYVNKEGPEQVRESDVRSLQLVEGRVRFSSGVGFHNIQEVVTLSLSKGDGSPKESLFVLWPASFDKLRMLVSRIKSVKFANSKTRPQSEIHP